MFYSAETGISVYSTREIMIRQDTAICVTGHREKMIQPYMNDPDNYDITCQVIKLMLGRYIDIIMDQGYTTLLSGLAEGTDLWAAMYTLSRKRFKKNTHCIGVMPYLRHSEGFSEENIMLLKTVERYSDFLVTTSDNRTVTYGRKSTPSTDPLVYRRRNYYLVDNSSVVIAFFNGISHSGTAQTLNYAEHQGRPIFSFGINDVYEILDRAGENDTSIYEEVRKIKLKVPKPAGIST